MTKLTDVCVRCGVSVQHHLMDRRTGLVQCPTVKPVKRKRVKL